MSNTDRVSITEKIGFKGELALVTAGMAFISFLFWYTGWRSIEAGVFATLGGAATYLAVELYQSHRREVEP